MSDTFSEEWMPQLERIAWEWSVKAGVKFYPFPLSKSTGVECWREMFEDGLTPQEAMDEDLKYG